MVQSSYAEKSIHIIGAGGHAKVVIELIESLGLRVAGIYDDRYNTQPHFTLLGYSLTGDISALPDQSDILAIIAIGNNQVRQRLDHQFTQLQWATLIHPFSWVAPSASLGQGTVVMAGAVIQAQASLGRHVIANTGCGIDHDCLLHDYVHIAPGSRLAGAVQIGFGGFFGVSASAIPATSIGEWSVVGAGAVVTQSLPPHITAIGIPAKVIKQH